MDIPQFIKGSKENNTARITARNLMAERLKHDPDLVEKLIPNWEVGCRRITPGEGYLESLLLPHVTITQSPIDRITDESIITSDGEEYKVDASEYSSFSMYANLTVA